jgi:hypothetical protein
LGGFLPGFHVIGVIMMVGHFGIFGKTIFFGVAAHLEVTAEDSTFPAAYCEAGLWI